MYFQNNNGFIVNTLINVDLTKKKINTKKIIDSLALEKYNKTYTYY
jgi:hypothetical protein